MRKQDQISFLTHAIGLFFALIGSVFLLYLVAKQHDVTKFIVTLIYAFGICWMFGASSIYHAKKKGENEVNIWRKFDHFAIFFSIAGTYTPLCYYYLSGSTRLAIIIAQWSLVFLGIIFKTFWLTAPRKLYTAIYLLMGWMIVIPLKSIVTSMTSFQLIMLFTGGALFTIGAIFYAIKKPNPIPGFFGFHEIFHIFIVGGIFSHFAVVYELTRNIIVK